MTGILRPGDHFAGRYRIDNEIGRGGMGVVYEAYDQELGRRVALKVLHPSLTDEEFRLRFQREASILARIRSRHIVTIHDFGEQEGRSYLITQLMTDGDLQSWLRHRGPLPRQAALSLTAQIAEALADAHAERVVHRDVKPGNVLLWTRPSGLVPYLCDFGIAVDGDASLTRTGTLIGSPAYMAPERHFGGQADERGDVYSTGCLLWAVLTGDAPYVGTDFQVANAHVNDPIPQLGSGTPEDVGIDQLLLRCLSKDPAQRLGSAAELQAELQSLLGRLSKGAATSLAANVSATISRADEDENSHAKPPADATRMRRATPVTVHKPPPAAPTVHKGPIQPRPSDQAGDDGGVAESGPPTGQRPGRRWLPAVAVAAVVVLIGGAIVGAVASRSGGDRPDAQVSPPSTVTTTSPSPPPPPRVKANGGYRSVAFSVARSSTATGPVAVEWLKDDQWLPVSGTIRVPTRQGGERACIRTRSAATVDGQQVTSEPRRTCGTADRRVVQLVRTDAPCARVIGGYSYRCVYYAVRLAGFASGTRPVAEIRPLEGRSWCSDPRYKDEFCKRVLVDKTGRGELARYFAINSETGRAVLDVDGVRTKPVHLCGPDCRP